MNKILKILVLPFLCGLASLYISLMFGLVMIYLGGYSVTAIQIIQVILLLYFYDYLIKLALRSQK